MKRNFPSTLPSSKILQKCELFNISAPRKTRQSIKRTSKKESN
ncbi:unnamed protein product [Brugia timori]|uniref:Uncharacterized protein n=1 Tax=Brugia timori TaxID=42155 RepID=A0A0R3RBR4_9BILA|nr:unnamed protein product [Brugia timori]